MGFIEELEKTPPPKPVKTTTEAEDKAIVEIKEAITKDRKSVTVIARNFENDAFSVMRFDSKRFNAVCAANGLHMTSVEGRKGVYRIRKKTKRD